MLLFVLTSIAFTPPMTAAVSARSAFAQRAPVAMIGNLGDSLKKAQDLMKNISPEKIKKVTDRAR
jgi:hypothetical protein